MLAIIARMKARLLNFSSDVAQIQALVDKSRSLESRKIFLDSLPPLRIMKGPKNGLMLAMKKFFQGAEPADH